MTDRIIILLKMMGVAEVLANLIAKILKEQNRSRIVDLGSGSECAMPEVVKTILEMPSLENTSLLLTDIYPNTDFVRRFNENTSDEIEYGITPVDATDIAKAAAGLKTTRNSFHHMPPKAVRSGL